MSRGTVLLTIISAVIVVASGQFSDRLGTSVTKPLHYDVNIKLDRANRRFLVNETIKISVLNNTNQISLHIRNDLSSLAWFGNTFVISEDGEEFRLTGYIITLGTDQLSFVFNNELKAGFNYTLQFTNIVGTLGQGLVQESLNP